METKTQSRSDPSSLGNTNNSPKKSPVRSQIKKRRVAKEVHDGWLTSKYKRLFICLTIAIIAWLVSQYGPVAMNFYYKSVSQKVKVSRSEQPQKSSESQSSEIKPAIKLPSGYTPSCQIKGKDSISAINRASSDTCKKQIADLACRSVDASDGIGNLYPTHLPNFCPTARTYNEELAGQYIGKK